MVEKTKPFRALKHIGKLSYSFEFTFYIDRVEDVPVGLDFIFSIQRGERLYSTSQCRSVQLSYLSKGLVAFREFINLPVTLYLDRSGRNFVAKDAKFFLRQIGTVREEPTTRGKIHMDLSLLLSRCSCDGEDSVFELSNGSKLYMTVSWIRKGMKGDSSLSLKQTADISTVSVHEYSNEMNVSVCHDSVVTGNNNQQTLSNDKTAMRPSLSSFDDTSPSSKAIGEKMLNIKHKLSQGVRKFPFHLHQDKLEDYIIQKLKEENTKLRKYLVETRREKEILFLSTNACQMEIAKLNAKLNGLRESVSYLQNNQTSNALSSTNNFVKLQTINRELEERLFNMEQCYKSRVAYLSTEIQKLENILLECPRLNCFVPKSCSQSTIETISWQPTKDSAQICDMNENDTKSFARNDKFTNSQTDSIQQQLSVQREEAASLLAQLIQTKISLAVTMEELEYSKLEAMKLKQSMSNGNSDSFLSKIFHWNFDS